MENDLEKKLKKLALEIKNGGYSPTSISYFFSFSDKPILSAKLDCRDLIASQAMLHILENELEKSAVPNCFFRMGKTDELLEKCREWKSKSEWVLVTDVKSFFASARHDFILKNLEKRCPEAIVSVNNYLKKMNEAGAKFLHVEPNFKHQKDRGLPVGIELPYLFSHALLHPIDLKMSKLETTIGYGRYIDDFIFFTKNEEDCEEAFSILKNEMSKFSLRLNPHKTTMLPTSETIHFLRNKI